MSFSTFCSVICFVIVSIVFHRNYPVRLTVTDLAIRYLDEFFAIDCPKNHSLYHLRDDDRIFSIQIVTTDTEEKQFKRCEVQSLQSSTDNYDMPHEKLNSTQSKTMIQACLQVSYLGNNGTAVLGSNEEDHEQNDSSLSPEETEFWKELPYAGRDGILSLMKGIYPGTLWCGFGNIADDHYNRLGEHTEADICCRAHDHCRPIIKGSETKHYYRNPSVFPVSHCSCDVTFYNCLKEANTTAANKIGHLFFNFAKMTCFDFGIRNVCTSEWFGTCFRHEHKCVAILKNNKRF